MQPNQKSAKNISYSSAETQRELRIERMNQLKSMGVDPFPPSSHRDYILSDVKNTFIQLQGKTVTLAGRVKKKRTSGKIAFATIEDESLPQGFQFVFKQDTLSNHKVWSLNFRIPEIMDKILAGTKSIETRALNPEEKEEGRYFGDIAEGDIIRCVDVARGGVHMYIVNKVEIFDSLDHAWESGLDFKRVGTSYTTLSELKTDYAEGLSPQYLNKIQTNGLVALHMAPCAIDQSVLTFDSFKKLIDEGDYIQATGVLDTSQSGEPSLFIEHYKLLTKSLRPLPEEITDIETLYRQRYMDMRINPDVRELFKKKSRFWSSTRDFMNRHGFVELIMPTMETHTGGAEATPFETHHNALDEDFYLRISSELHQKRMIAGGFEKIYDIDKNFRNEGIDDEHLQEFTQMEFYWAYADYNDLLDYCEKLMKHVVHETFGTLQLQYDDERVVDWSQDWPRIPYYDFVEQYAGIKLKDYNTVEKLRALADSLSLEYEESAGYGRLVDLIYKKTARPACIDPVWLIDQPVELSPLAKRIPERPELTQRLQLIAYGSELCNGYSELNDPLDQLARFEEQQSLREGGDSEAMMLDHDFVTALEVGIPPTAGFAYSERLFSVLARKPIRECTPFPLMKREDSDKKKVKTQVFHIVLHEDDDTPLWQYMNAIAHLSGSVIAHNRLDKEVIEIESVYSRDGNRYPMDMRWGVVIKKTKDRDHITQLYSHAQEAGLKTTVFAKEFFEAKDDHAAINNFRMKDSDDLGWIGVLLYGKKSTVEELTDDLDYFD